MPYQFLRTFVNMFKDACVFTLCLLINIALYTHDTSTILHILLMFVLSFIPCWFFWCLPMAWQVIRCKLFARRRRTALKLLRGGLTHE